MEDVAAGQHEPEWRRREAELRSSKLSARGVGTNVTVMPTSTSQSRRARGAAATATSGTWRLAPAVRYGHTSHTDASEGRSGQHRSPVAFANPECTVMPLDEI